VRFQRSGFPCPTDRSVHPNIPSLRLVPDHLLLHLVKNFETKCEGLSVGLFIFAIAGNSCYALSIIAASMERQYLVRNGSWLAGMCIASRWKTASDL
jgi:hypothetical protein